MEVFLSVIIGVLGTLGVTTYFKSSKEKALAKNQSTILIDKIKRVCKFITVEGDFAEIYHYEDVKERFLKMITSRKKALVLVNAKAHVGFDLTKIKMQSFPKEKKVVLSHFPQPEILSIETNLNYYDKKEGMFNKFEANDLTDLNAEAKQHIIDKVPETNLFKIAKKEALESILLIESIVQTIGWTLDYSALEIDSQEVKVLSERVEESVM